MQPELKMPWEPDGDGIYDSDGPMFDVEFPVGTHTFRVERIHGQSSTHTGRRLYFVKCTTCKVIVSECTNGPRHWIERHVEGTNYDLPMATDEEVRQHSLRTAGKDWVEGDARLHVKLPDGGELVFENTQKVVDALLATRAELKKYKQHAEDVRKNTLWLDKYMPFFGVDNAKRIGDMREVVERMERDIAGLRQENSGLHNEVVEKTEWLISIGKVIGCGHVNENLPRCIREEFTNLEEENERMRKAVDKAIAALDGLGGRYASVASELQESLRSKDPTDMSAEELAS